MSKDEQTKVAKDMIRTAITIPRGHAAYLKWLAATWHMSRDGVIVQIIEEHNAKAKSQGVDVPGL